MVIIMLNLLIAIISDTYERVSAVSDVTYEKNRMKILCEIGRRQNEPKIAQIISHENNKYLITLFAKDPDVMENENQANDRIRQRVEQISKVI